MAGLLEALACVPACEIHDFGHSTGMVVQVTCDVIYEIVDHNPTALLRLMSFHHFHADGLRNAHFWFRLSFLFALYVFYFLLISLGILLFIQFPHKSRIPETNRVLGVLGFMKFRTGIESAPSAMRV